MCPPDRRVPCKISVLLSLLKRKMIENLLIWCNNEIDPKEGFV